jgi:hypothetical protein
MKKGIGSGVGSGAGSGSIRQRYGCGDPDPHQNVVDPQHWLAAFRQCFHNGYRYIYSIQLCGGTHVPG